jgi:hypothetical protein
MPRASCASRARAREVGREVGRGWRLSVEGSEIAEDRRVRVGHETLRLQVGHLIAVEEAPHETLLPH